MTHPTAERTEPTPWVLPLEAPENTLETVGGKGANLGEMLRAHLPVPTGFCVTTAAYLAVVSSSVDEPLLEDLVTLESPEDPRLVQIAGNMRQALQQATLPPDLERAILQAYDALGAAVPVAVRSSATAEDLPTASFAGQQDTYLGVVGHEALLDSVQKCWASLWNERAASYRAANRIDPRGVRLSVVVQRMIEAQVAGVLFTANPITGSRRQVVINASPGLGEAVVSGAVNPDHFVIDRHTGTVIERRLGDKRIAIWQVAGGGTVREERAPAEGLACIDEAQLRRLTDLGMRVEAHFGAPQDIEFAFDDTGRLWRSRRPGPSRPCTPCRTASPRPTCTSISR